MQPLEDGSLGWLHLGTAALWSLLDRLRIGVVVLDGTAGVLGMNSTARDILSAGDAVVARDGVLDAVSTADRDGMRRLVDTTVEPSGAPDGRGLSLPRGERRRPLEVVGLSLRAVGSAEGADGPAGLLLLHDPDLPCATHREQLMRELYRLTPAEARVATALIEGRTVDEASAALGLSRHTVRTHVKHVLAKTSARSQTDLVRRVLAGPLALLRVGQAAP